MQDCKFVIQVPVVVNQNSAQVLVVTEIPLTPPAFKINEIEKLIEIDDSLTPRSVCNRWAGRGERAGSGRSFRPQWRP